MNPEEQIANLQKALVAMSEQQDIMAAELVGTKKAIAVMAAFLPMTQDEVKGAWETAIAQVGSAIESGEIPSDMQTTELETIRELIAVAGMAWRGKTGAR